MKDFPPPKLETLQPLAYSETTNYNTLVLEAFDRLAHRSNLDDTDEFVKNQAEDTAFEDLIDFLIINPEALVFVVRELDLKHTDSIGSVHLMERIFSYVKRTMLGLISPAKDVWSLGTYISRIAETLKDHGIQSETDELYFPSKRLFHLLSSETGDVDDTHLLDRDSLVPFEITKGVYAVFSRQDNAVKLIRGKDIMYDFSSEISKKYVDTYARSGKQKFRDDTYLQLPQDMLNIADFIENKGSSTKEFFDKAGMSTRANELNDYEGMLHASFRMLLEDEFGIRLADLSIPEQFHFLNYLKHTTVGSVETMRIFIKAYGVDAMRSFLANAYDPNAAENIMIFGTMIEHQTAATMFASYAQSLDATADLTEQLRVTSESSSTVATLATELQSGMLKRAGHLFAAGKQIALCEYSGEEEIVDLVAGYKGLAVMTDVLAHFQDNSRYTIRTSEMVAGDSSMSTRKMQIENNATNETFLLKVSVRPHATERGEARINFELNLDSLPDTSEPKRAFTQTTEFKGTNGRKARTVTGSVIRLGFDLDTRTTPPTFSFDMGRDAYNGDDMTRTGDVLGRILSYVAPQGHHLRDFSPELSNPENFALLAEAITRRFSLPMAVEEKHSRESVTADGEPGYYLL